MSKRGVSLLILIFLIFSIVNVFIILKNNTPLVYDEADYFLLSFNFHSLLKNFFKVNLATTINDAVTFYETGIPPLFPLSISLAHFIPGLNQHLFPLVNLFYLGLLIFLIYKLGLSLKDEQTGILAAFITLSMPIMFAFSRTLYLDFALTTVVVLNFYFILKAIQSPSLKNFVFLGLTTGAGMLCKYTFLIYTFIPIIILFISSLRRKKTINLAVYLILSLLIISPYYLLIPLLNKVMFGEIIDRYIHRTIFNELPSIKLYLRKLLIYLQALRQSQIGNAYFFLFLVSFMHFLFNKSKNISFSPRLIILTWLTIPYLIIIAFPFLINPVNARHVLPLLPVMALLISFFVMKLKNLRVRYILCFIIVMFATIQFLTLSFKNFLHPQEKLTSQEIYGNRFNYGLVSPYTIDLKQKVIFKTIREFGPEIILIPDTPYPALISSLKLEDDLNDSPLNLVYPHFYKLKTTKKETFEEINNALTDSKCVMVIRSHKIDPRGTREGLFGLYTAQTHNLLRKAFQEQQTKFTLHKKFILSDKDVYIYIRKTD